MLNLNDLRIFVQAVDSGGFAAAARLAGQPKSTVSKRVAELEAELGARLIHRTSRSFALTDLGRAIYDHARAATIEAETVEDIVRRRTSEPVGPVRITASVPGARFRIAPLLPALLWAFPRIEPRLHVSDRFVDIVHEGFDIALRSHRDPLPDSGLVQRRLSVERIVPYAAPAYLEAHGTPMVPSDLTGHDGIDGGPPGPWRLFDDGGAEIAATPRSRLTVDEAGLLAQAARAGLGVALLPETIAAPDVAAGALRPLLPGWSAGTITTTILTPHRRGQLPAVRAVIDFLLRSGPAPLDEPSEGS